MKTNIRAFPWSCCWDLVVEWKKERVGGRGDFSCSYDVWRRATECTSRPRSISAPPVSSLCFLALLHPALVHRITQTKPNASYGTKRTPAKVRHPKHFSSPLLSKHFSGKYQMKKRIGVIFYVGFELSAFGLRFRARIHEDFVCYALRTQYSASQLFPGLVR